MAEVKLKEETELWEPRGPCGSWGPAEEPRGPCGSWGPAEEHTHSEAWKLPHIKEEPQEFPFHMVTVKTEDDEDKSSVLHQSEENREETNGWDCGAEAGCSSVCEEEHLKVEEELLNGEDDGAESDWSWEWEGPPLRQTLSERRTASTMEPNPDISFPSVRQKLPDAPVSVKTHQRPPEENKEESQEEHPDGSEDTDNSEEYCDEQAPTKRSYAMVPPDADVSSKMPYNCPECGKGFRWKSHLQMHKFSHSGEKPHKCPVCKKRFTQKGNLATHLKTKHLMCPVCEVRFPDDMNLKEHLKSHKENRTVDPSILKPHSCPECGKNFRQKSQLRDHKFIHSGEKPHRCSVCEKRFREKGTLSKHLKTKHHMCPVCKVFFPDDMKLKNHLKTHVEDGTADQSILKCHHCLLVHSGETPHKCSVCEKYFNCKSVLCQHVQIKHHMCPVCKKEISDRIKLEEHLKAHVEDGTADPSILKSCPECGKDFTNDSNLRRHMMVHKPERRHKCLVCEKIYSNKSDLSRHQKFVHHMCPVCKVCFPDSVKLKEHLKTHVEDGTADQSILKSHVCPECGKEFRSNSELQDHKFSHSGEKPHKCPECGMRFRRKLQLAHHKLTHSGDKPHQCSKCGMKFTRKPELKRHMFRHTEEGPHKCPVCEKCFIVKVYLAHHQRTKHLMCPVCKVYFPDHKNLKEHLKTHEEDGTVDPSILKSHSCTQCFKEFPFKSALEAHEVVHSKKKPSKCSLCKKRFSCNSYLTRHLRTMHHVCPVCKEGFPDLIELQEHLKTHEEDRTLDQLILKSYSCPECGKKFLHRSSLSRHRFVHSGEKPHKCSVCEKDFSRKSILTRHLRTKHHMCSVCKLYFPDNMNLKEHLETHVEDGTLDKSILKFYKCPECGKKFQHRSSLNRHAFFHSGEKPHKCSVRKRYFSHKSILTRHLRAKHTMCSL